MDIDIKTLKASEELSRIWGTGYKLLTNISFFYDITSAGLFKGSTEKTSVIWESLLKSYNEKELHNYLKEPEAAEEFLQEIHEKLPTMQQKLQDTAQKNINAASIVFAHGVIEEFAYGYLTITSWMKPESWEYLIENKKVEIKSLKNKPYKEICGEKIDKLIKSEISRKSLIHKMDLLHKIAPPKTDFILPPESFLYDRKRIIKLDDIRQKIVHGNDWDIASINFVTECDYWLRLNAYLAALVCGNTGLKLITSVAAKHVFRQPKET